MKMCGTPIGYCRTQNAWARKPVFAACCILFTLFVSSISLAEPVELGRLFYSSSERAQLEHARARNITRIDRTGKRENPVAPMPAPTRFDGIVIRPDGQSTRWVNGKAEVGPSSVSGLKPGQIRANGKVYEPYQILRPQPPAAAEQAPLGSTP